ncbi:MAG TPA: hypothetical protein VKB91_00515 [Gemmatimonadaceae bacterium]|nr:hypothetical protein [Gemmatimonadaceae bacterium]
MPPRRKKRSGGKTKVRKKPVSDSDKGRLRRARPGLPTPDTIIEIREMMSPSGKKIRLLRTNQQDPYDPPE